MIGTKSPLARSFHSPPRLEYRLRSPKLKRRTHQAEAIPNTSAIGFSSAARRVMRRTRDVPPDMARKPEDMIMNTRTMKHGLVVAVAGTIVLGAVAPSWSAPVLSSTTAVKAAAPSEVTDVRYRNRGHYRHNRAYRHNGAGAGVALGILGAAGALAAGAAYRHNYYGPGYYSYGPGYYQQGYGGYANGPGNYGYYGSPHYGYQNY
jgi:hypothetical protein